MKKLLLLLLLGSVFSIKAAEISGRQAALAAENWMKRNPRPFKSMVGQTVLETKTYRNDLDAPLFHVVRFEEGGFVVTSADDGIQPVIAFSSGDDLVADPRNPFWALLNRDMSQRLAGVSAVSAQVQLLNAVPLEGAHEKEWQELLADDDVSTSGLSSVSDLRVSPLVQSEWDQSTVSGYYTYNYYTPNHYVCGCVATAGSQVMRYHQWPSGSVSAGTYTCFVDGSTTSLTMQGGTYSWSDMPLVPTSSITLAQRQAIGKLTSDVGIACYMDYASDGSGAYSQNLSDAFTDRFGYANARLMLNQQSGVDGYLQEAVLSNLDAGFPVVFGIQGDGGHEVVGDGYGYSSSTLYIHLNMGWSGSSDAWYCLPDVYAGGYSFDVLGSIIYNIFPENTGEIISGRVLDGSGNPVSGVTVVAENGTLGTILPSVTSDANGIYAFLVPEPGSPSTHTYTITATSGSLTGEESTTVSASVSTTADYDENTGGGSYYPGTGSVGNSWGVDLTLVDPSAVTLSSIIISGVSSLNENTSASYTCTAYYSDGSSADVTASATWSENSAYASISSSGLLTASSVSSDQSVTVSASYTEGGVTKTDTHSVTIVDVAVGDAYEPDNSAAAAKTIIPGETQSRSIHIAGDEDWVKFTISARADVTLETSGSSGDSVIELYGPDSSTSLLESDDDDGVGYFSLIQRALAPGEYYLRIIDYGNNGTIDSYQLSLDVVVKALSSITITGASSLYEMRSESYTCTAYYSDGSSADVTASAIWSENSAYAAISSSGLLTVTSVSSDQPVTVSASYSEEGVTKTDTHALTIINIPVMALPYSESFESGLGSWVASDGNDMDWLRYSGNTPSTSTGPASASDGTYYVYVEATSPNYPSKTAGMELGFDFSGVSNPELTFDYHMYGYTMGTLYVDVYDGTWHSGVWSLSGQQQTSSSAAWLGATVDLSAYIGVNDITVRFRGVTGSSHTGDMAIDNIQLVDQVPDTVPFETWVINAGIPEDQRGESDTPAGDGIANLLKYACGLSAMEAYSSSDLMSIVDGETSVFSIRYFKSKSATDVTLEPIWATSLSGSWSAIGITDMLLNDGTEREERKASIPLDESGFIRLRATSTP